MIDKDEKVDSMGKDAVPAGSTDEDPPNSNHAINDGATRDGRSDSMATERPRTEFYDSAEYPHNDSGANTNEYNATIEMKDDCGMVDSGDGKMQRGNEHGGRYNILTRFMTDGVYTAGMDMDMNMAFGNPRIRGAVVGRIA
ncbi:MAG: hypothetical protein Q9180_008338 [Flavoplaca navasiana]